MTSDAVGSLSALAVAVRAERLTYLSPAKLARLEQAIAEAGGASVAGDFVEFGVALGGASIVMATAARAAGRAFVGLDVFGMIPAPTSEQDDVISRERYASIRDGESAGIDGDTYYGYREDLLADVVAAFARHGLAVDGQNVVLEKGLFDATWPAHLGRRIALAHIDCDWYDPVRFCLEVLATQLSPGGLAVLDDYHAWSGARAATDEFLAGHGDFAMEDGPNVILRRHRL